MNTFDYIVKKYNINLDGRYFIDIPEMVGSKDLAKLFAELGFTKGAEIGTDEGIYAEYLLNTIPGLLLYCIDPWDEYAYEENGQPESFERQKYFENRMKRAEERIKGKAHILRETSEEALDEFEDNSLDFVYIDGNHDFVNVAFDIHNWLKKVRVGGILAGHDYVRYPTRKQNHVKRVVQAYFPSYALLPVFAVMQDKHGMKRDRFRSWFFVKK